MHAGVRVQGCGCDCSSWGDEATVSSHFVNPFPSMRITMKHPGSKESSCNKIGRSGHTSGVD